jgi:hypothetical protein
MSNQAEIFFPFEQVALARRVVIVESAVQRTEAGFNYLNIKNFELSMSNQSFL